MPEDLKSIALDEGCEKALEQAIGIIASMERQVAGLTHTVGVEAKTVGDQQAVITEQSTQIGQISQALAEAQVALATASQTIANQQDTITLQQTSITQLTAELVALTAPHPAVRAVLTINGGPPMAAVSITVDDTTGKATLAFEDDHGDVVPAPAGAVITFTSDNTAAITVATDPADPTGQTGDLSVAAGALAGQKANIGATVVDSTGAPLFTVTPVEVDLIAGPAAQVVLSVTP